ncbi:MAG: Maf family protein [Candidatus Pacebacteria bacterium]|nr:Maf family protein [Candidatus Paceibacterota bacterium]
MKIILGSQSIYRKKILEEMGFDFEVMVSGIDEKAIRFKDPKELVAALAKAKADAIKPNIFEEAILITSDQVVVWEKEIREKPENEEEARRFLKSYGSSPVETVTAVAVSNLATGETRIEVDIAKIYFSPFSENEISDIIADGEVFCLAGGFSIDGERWEGHVQRVEGARDSVMGLPKEVTKRLIEEVI